MADVAGGGTGNVTLYDEAGNQFGTPGNPLAATVVSTVAEPDATTTGTITVTDTGSQTANVTTQDVTHKRITGTPTPGSSVSIGTLGMSSYAVDVSGSWNGQLTIERTIDGVTWADINAFVAGTGLVVKAFTSNGAYYGTAASSFAVRVRASTGFNGTATITFRAGHGVGAIPILTPIGVKDALNPNRQLTVGANGAARVEAVDTAGTAATVRPYNHLRVSQEDATLLYDPFQGAVLDTVDRWAVVGAAPTQATSQLVPSTAVSTVSGIRSQAVFQSYSSQFNALNMSALIGTAPATGAGRFWGFGVQAATVTPTTLVSEGIGFEVDATTGDLQAVYYVGGTKTVVATLPSAGTPTGLGAVTTTAVPNYRDNIPHRYSVVYRQTRTYWYIDSNTRPVATLEYLPLNQTELPVLILRANAAAYTGTPQFVIPAVGVGDPNRLATQVSDGMMPWRKARVVDPASIPNAGQYSATDRSYGGALNTNNNAVQKATYRAVMKPTAAASTANVFQPRVALFHPATATRAIRIRRITLQGNSGVAAATTGAEVHRIVAAPTGTIVAAGTASATATTNTNLPTDLRDPAPEAVAYTTVTAATSVGIVASDFIGLSTAATSGAAGGCTVYEWRNGGEEKPLLLRPGVAEGVVVGIISTAATTWNLTVEIIYTEE